MHVKDISPKSYIFCKIFRQNCIIFANFVIKIKHISTVCERFVVLVDLYECTNV